jgi:2-methylisocitrate lyase-like PEP mutase family enzyme
MTTNAEIFRGLHHGPKLLLLPNCWDAASARVLEDAGARALATTSAGVAWSNGYPDGDAIPVERVVATVRAITRVIKVPLSVDVESGYSADPMKVGDLAAALVDAGAVGINIEDGSGPPEVLTAKIEHVKRAVACAGVDFFVNARTDVYLRDLVPEEARVEETLARARRYRDAGADGLFVPLMTAPTEIRAIATSIALPLNVLACAGLPASDALFGLGARRLSAGSGLAQLALGHVALAAERFLRDGDFRALHDGAIAFARMDALVSG